MDTHATNAKQEEEILDLENQLPEETDTEEPADTQESVTTIEASERNAEEEINTLKDQLLRAVAETENVRRRAEKQVDDAGKYAVTNFARDLISVLENLYRAGEAITLEAITDNPLLKNIHDGVEMTKRELINVFDKHGIKRIDPAMGEAFDPHFHQAVAHIPSAEYPEGSIVHVMQAGYTIKDRLLRPAMVGVAKTVEATQ